MNSIAFRCSRALINQVKSSRVPRRFGSTASSSAENQTGAGSTQEEINSELAPMVGFTSPLWKWGPLAVVGVVAFIHFDNSETVGTTHPISRFIENMMPDPVENQKALAKDFEAQLDTAQYFLLERDEVSQRRPLRLSNPFYFVKGSPYGIMPGRDVDMSEVAKISPVRK
ncbi:hypothetical protein H4219_005801 [Mycoemilia scoparia]|uniref:Uncharacterized protein n=1 Tax=Mycoemilia scoparia TaxID=417184 RepID=A0A9W7ZMY2_9FUNG|nr:hypothetical protein H4219_005801 [Mycoemilia scoparia]